MRNGREKTHEEIIKERHEHLKRCETKKSRHTQRRKLQRKNALPALLASASNFDYKARKAEQKAAQIRQQEEQDQRLRDQARVDEAHNLLKQAYKMQKYEAEMKMVREREVTVRENGRDVVKVVKYTLAKELFRMPKEQYNKLPGAIKIARELEIEEENKQKYERLLKEQEALRLAERDRLIELVRENNFSKESIAAQEEYDFVTGNPTFIPKEAMKEEEEIMPREERCNLPLEVQRNLYSEFRVPSDVNESIRFTKKLMENGPCVDDLRFYLSVGWNPSDPQGKEICFQDEKIRVLYITLFNYMSIQLLFTNHASCTFTACKTTHSLNNTTNQSTNHSII